MASAAAADPTSTKGGRRDYGTLPTTQEAPGDDGVVVESGPASGQQQQLRRLVPGWAYLMLFVLLYSGGRVRRAYVT
jgi:hypothetical protein